MKFSDTECTGDGNKNQFYVALNTLSLYQVTGISDSINLDKMHPQILLPKLCKYSARTVAQRFETQIFGNGKIQVFSAAEKMAHNLKKLKIDQLQHVTD